MHVVSSNYKTKSCLQLEETNLEQQWVDSKGVLECVLTSLRLHHTDDVYLCVHPEICKVKIYSRLKACEIPNVFPLSFKCYSASGGKTYFTFPGRLNRPPKLLPTAITWTLAAIFLTGYLTSCLLYLQAPESLVHRAEATVSPSICIFFKKTSIYNWKYRCQFENWPWKQNVKVRRQLFLGTQPDNQKGPHNSPTFNTISIIQSSYCGLFWLMSISIIPENLKSF